MIFHSIWDTQTDHQEFVEAYRTFAERKYGATGERQGDISCWHGEEAICLYDGDQSVIVVKATNLQAATSIMSTQTQ